MITRFLIIVVNQSLTSEKNGSTLKPRTFVFLSLHYSTIYFLLLFQWSAYNQSQYSPVQSSNLFCVWLNHRKWPAKENQDLRSKPKFSVTLNRADLSAHIWPKFFIFCLYLMSVVCGSNNNLKVFLLFCMSYAPQFCPSFLPLIFNQP